MRTYALWCIPCHALVPLVVACRNIDTALSTGTVRGVSTLVALAIARRLYGTLDVVEGLTIDLELVTVLRHTWSRRAKFAIELLEVLPISILSITVIVLPVIVAVVVVSGGGVVVVVAVVAVVVAVVAVVVIAVVVVITVVVVAVVAVVVIVSAISTICWLNGEVNTVIIPAALSTGDEDRLKEKVNNWSQPGFVNTRLGG